MTTETISVTPAEPITRYESSEVSAAKNHAYEALQKQFEADGIYPHDEESPVNLIGLADAVVEGLLAAGVTIPEELEDPHGHF